MKTLRSLLILAAVTISTNALADKPKRDGLWRGNGGAALSISSGNTKSESLNLTADAARLTADDKLSLYLQILGSRADSTSNGVTTSTTTANQWSAGTRYDHTITGEMFGFGALDFSRDQIKLLSLRSVASVGLGYHVVKTDDNQWDVFGGIAYRTDKYDEPGVLVRNELRTGISATELPLGEESNHKLTESTSFRQKLVVSPDLTNKGTRATFDAGLRVALNKTMSLSMTLQNRYDSTAEALVKKNDLLFFTGINVKFGG
jgi:putative salt-induced outer membrane protein YdiY